MRLHREKKGVSRRLRRMTQKNGYQRMNAVSMGERRGVLQIAPLTGKKPSAKNPGSCGRKKNYLQITKIIGKSDQRINAVEPGEKRGVPQTAQNDAEE